MSKLLKGVLVSAAAAGAAFAGWRFVQGGAAQPPPERRRPGTNGDFAAEGHGAAGELTPEQREKLLEELEDQLGA